MTGTASAGARNLDQVAPPSTDSGEQVPQTSQKKPWQRMEGEPSLWWNRYQLYLELGYKRTLLAALQKEQEKITVLKSTQTGEKSRKIGTVELSNSGKPRAKRRQTEGNKSSTKAGHLAEVEKPKPVQVPSSWKIAAQKWHWKERCQAYDEYLIDKTVEDHLKEFMNGASVTINRVNILKSLLETALKLYNGNNERMTFDVHLAFFARIQSILRDIREEMSGYDEAVTRVILRQQMTKLYRKATPEMLDLQRLEQEQARRAQERKIRGGY